MRRLRPGRTAATITRLAALAGCALAIAGMAHAGERRSGQWVWCAADRDHFAAVQRQRADLIPAIWVATMEWREGRVAMRLAHPPSYVRGAERVALVVRFDDSVHAAWDSHAEQLAAAVDAKLTWLLAETARLGVAPVELQLDYDAPVRRLSAWAALLRRLHGGALAGREVWITSLPAHMAQPSYGDWMRPWVSGHILQLFDTGAEPTAGGDRLAERTAAMAMPFRVGVGAFERVRGVAPAAVTQHAAWIAELPAFARQPGFSGVWVFPGGMRWSPALLAGVR